MPCQANYLTQAQYSAAKSALTRAKKKGPDAVIQEVSRRYAHWNDNDYVYPDDWHRWERAQSDAELALRYQR